MEIPHCAPPRWPSEISPGRFASLVRTESAEGCRVALLGLADDEGVRLNGGRPGCRDGPRAFRAALSRYGAAHPPSAWVGVFDAGDIVPGDSLEETHARVTEATGALLEAGLMPVGIGGGHDLTFPFVRAACERHGAMVGVYCDAHLDVREEPGSGMPFRALVERCAVRALYAHGIDLHAARADHLQWFQAHGGHLDPFGPGDEWPEGDLFVSLDLDVVDMGFAPGVSAPNPCGWLPRELDAWARAAGRCPSVRAFDLMELNPAHDEGGRTARLAARLFLAFLAGFAERRA